jgi:uncharacterized protein with beta-barrel porin domain
LSYTARSELSPRGEFGARFDADHDFDDSTRLSLLRRAAWAHEFDAVRAASATFQSLPGADFTVIGTAPAADTVVGRRCCFADGWSVAGKYDAELVGDTRNYAGRETVSYVW